LALSCMLPSYGHGVKRGYTDFCRDSRSTSWSRWFAPCGGCVTGKAPTRRNPLSTTQPIIRDVCARNVAPRSSVSVEYFSMSSPPNRPVPPNWPPRSVRPRPASASGRAQSSDQYDSFNASLLYCGTCRQATPTRQRLLLVLPTGNLYEYLCAQCGSSTGSKTENASSEGKLFAP